MGPLNKLTLAFPISTSGNMHLNRDGLARLGLIRKNTLLLGNFNLHRLGHRKVPNLIATRLGELGDLASLMPGVYRLVNLA